MTIIPQTTYEALEPGTYRARVGAVAVEDGMYGKQVALRFDLLAEESAGRFVKAWAAAKLSGGKQPSKLYAWASTLLFGGKPLPEGYDLDTDSLLGREALAVIEVKDKDGLLFNRVAQLLPVRPARKPPETGDRRQEAAAVASAGGWRSDEDWPF